LVATSTRSGRNRNHVAAFTARSTVINVARDKGVGEGDEFLGVGRPGKSHQDDQEIVALEEELTAPAMLEQILRRTIQNSTFCNRVI
jgi:hypothetical protein